MSKIERLQQNNQPRMALQLIEKLLKDHQDNAWLNNQRAMALLGDNRYEEARDVLVAFLRKNPDQPLANALLALAMTELEPVAQCKKVIHRAFLKSMSAEPQIVAILAGKLVDYFLASGKDMAARQHMAVVLRLEREEERQQTLVAMLEMDSESSTPYPLRGAHPLPQYQPSSEQAAQFKKAQRLYVHACYAEAADLLDQIVEQDANSPQLWHTIGLMRAWDGDEERATVALRRAAALDTDFEQAVDIDTVAQLLEQRLPENMVAARSRVYEVDSMARLLTRLDNEDRLNRITLSEEALQANAIAGYEILDRPIPPDSELPNLTLATLPRTMGQITLFDRQEDETPAVAHVNALEGDRLTESLRIFEAAAGELAKPTPAEKTSELGPDADVLAWYSTEELALSESVFFPAKTPGAVRNRLRREIADQCSEQTWLKTPLSALQNKSPLEAVGEESLKVPLAAALRAFDSFMDRRNSILDTTQLRKQLQLPEPSPISPTEEMDVNILSVSQLKRLEFSGLSDEMFNRVMQRVLVVKHRGLIERVLTEFLENRPELVKSKPENVEQAYMVLVDVYSQSLQTEKAFEWQDKGFEYLKAHNAPFEALMLWKMRELSLRASDTDDPRFKEVMLELWNHYGAKMPAVRARLEEFVRILEIEAPWGQAILTPQTMGSGVGAAWSADTAQSSTSEKKLWLPD